MMAMRLLALAGTILFLLQTLPAQAADVKHGFLHLTHKDAEGKEAKYQLFVPHDYDGQKEYPLILFLHGSGETGTEGERQTRVGLGPVVKKHEKSFPFFVLFPQSHQRTWRAGSRDADRVLAILDEVSKQYKIDASRVYLTGLSMGGFGTWSLAAKYPERWAAIVPICGGGDPKSAESLKDMPCWCFHGDADKAVPVALSRRMMAALWKAGAHPNYTEYPRVGHNSWDQAYSIDYLYHWLLEHQRTKKTNSK